MGKRGPKAEFWNKVEKTPSGCWLWTGAKSARGYGAVWIRDGIKKTSLRAHRVSWEITKGAIPQGLHVLHHCDVPACVNPDHLYLGTNADNVADAIARKRYKPLRGEAAPNAKLTVEQVHEIRESKEPSREIGLKFGISSMQVSRIRRGIAWSNMSVSLSEDC